MRQTLRQFFLKQPLTMTVPMIVLTSIASSVGTLFLLTELMGTGYGPTFVRSLTIATVAPTLVSGPIGGFIVHLLREVEAARQQAQSLAWNDELTGLLNRRRFVELGTRELRLAQRQHTTLSAVLLDVDDFKRINDRHGHAAGDAVLQAIGRLLPGALRSTDIAARWGGEEFALLLPGAVGTDTVVVTERVRESIERLAIAAGGGQPLRCTVSIGVADATDTDTFDSLINRADRAMYRAKAAGKNSVLHEEAA